MPEDRVSFIADTLEEFLGLHPSSWKLVHQTAETILQLAELGHVILVGRGANVITQGLAQVCHVRLVGSFERRCKRVEARHKITSEAACRYIRKEDAARKRYVQKHYDRNIDDPLLYHLVINTDWLAVEEAADLVARLMLQKYGLASRAVP